MIGSTFLNLSKRTYNLILPTQYFYSENTPFYYKKFVILTDRIELGPKSKQKKALDLLG